ncbi:hypothetical protein COU13_00600 [Candidatus Kaiserbacteria bacterium CG10_big_fil_rev_8_21_14_0_10_43_70]|uniref:Phage shock protein PspC N-terminal domain-containing protein n=1 Tax=Candidatus Kaiserbacteria bacterium CG10_big_fil_rev_8_21_14_0_10_43_70 TaxID=1974605 RepID=A0A2H0UJB0_9BACT|nr:MAG: hypothetical protein COU13_00600 [Candidatus Kaiserbacteria bacterium CG10_big_fil_rev_8_21_14_0_10_43_70]
MKKLKRSTTNRIISGVIGGFSEYFNIDVVLLRVVFVFFLLVTGLFPGVIAYIVAIFMIPINDGTIVH